MTQRLTLGTNRHLRYNTTMKKISINQLRFISFIEGISFTTLLFIGMPLKYGIGIKSVNMALGMGHGLLTMVFCLVLGLIWLQKKHYQPNGALVFIASLLPFGAFVAEKEIKRFSIDTKSYSIIKPCLNQNLMK